MSDQAKDMGERWNALTRSMVDIARHAADMLDKGRAPAKAIAPGGTVHDAVALPPAVVETGIEVIRKLAGMVETMQESQNVIMAAAAAVVRTDNAHERAALYQRALGLQCREDRRQFDAMRDAFNAALQMLHKAVDEGDVLGAGPRPAAPPVPQMLPWGDKGAQLAELYDDIHGETTDDDPRDVVLRAMAVYRSFVKHARRGGQVKFVKDGEKDRVLKVRLR